MSAAERAAWFLQLPRVQHDRPSWVGQELVAKVYASNKDMMTKQEIKDMLLSCGADYSGSPDEARPLEEKAVDKMLGDFFSFYKFNDEASIKVFLLQFQRMELFHTIKYLRFEYSDDQIPGSALYRCMIGAAGDYQGEKMAKYLCPDRFSSDPVQFEKIVNFYFHYEEMLKKDAVKGGALDKFDTNKELLRATQEGHSSQVKVVLSRKDADPNTADQNGVPMLHVAIEAHFEDVVVALLAAKADPNAVNLGGLSGMHVALEDGNTALLNDLIHNGADLNQVCDDQTPLMAAVLNANDSAVALLLKEGADKEIKNSEGQTALDLANQIEDEDAIAMLTGEDPVA